MPLVCASRPCGSTRSVTVTRLSVMEASAHMLAGVRPLGHEDVPLERALGRVLARDVVSPVSLPPRDNASMDGFAVQADDVRGASESRPVELRVIGTIAAGGVFAGTIGRGEAARIMTGAYVPAGADSVVRVEDTGGDVDVVSIRDDRDAGRNIRLRGEDVRADQVVMRAGVRQHVISVGLFESRG